MMSSTVMSEYSAYSPPLVKNDEVIVLLFWLELIFFLVAYVGESNVLLTVSDAMSKRSRTT